MLENNGELTTFKLMEIVCLEHFPKRSWAMKNFTIQSDTWESSHLFQRYVFDGLMVPLRLTKMEAIGYWGTQVEIYAAANLLKTEIYQTANVTIGFWICYRPNEHFHQQEKC